MCSGLKEEDYPVIEDVNIPLLTDVRRVPLPPELVEQFGRILFTNVVSTPFLNFMKFFNIADQTIFRCTVSILWKCIFKACSVLNC